MKLTELLRQRSSLSAQAQALATKAAAVSAELESIDAELYSRMKSLVVAIEGDEADRPLNGSAERQSLLPDAPFRLGLPRSKARRISVLAHQIAEALKAAGKPMDRNAVYDLLVARGVDVPGKDKKANLSAHLSYSPLFERTKDGLWTLSTKEVPEQRQTPADAGA